MTSISPYTNVDNSGLALILPEATQQAQLVGALQGYTNHDPNLSSDDSNLMTSLVRGGQVGLAQAQQALGYTRANRIGALNSLAQLQAAAKAGGQPPASNDQSAPTDQAAPAAPAASPDLVQTHLKVADSIDGLTDIPPGPQRVAAAQQLIQQHSQDWGLDPSHPEVQALLSKVNDDNALHNAAAANRKAAMAAQAPQNPLTAPQGPQQAPQAAQGAPQGAPAVAPSTTGITADQAAVRPLATPQQLQGDNFFQSPEGQAMLAEASYYGVDTSHMDAAQVRQLAPYLEAQKDRQTYYNGKPQLIKNNVTGQSTLATGSPLAAHIATDNYGDITPEEQARQTAAGTNQETPAQISVKNPNTGVYEMWNVTEWEKAHPGQPLPIQPGSQGAPAPAPASAGQSVAPQQAFHEQITGIQQQFGLIPTSGMRTAAKNAAVGGATNSLHMQGWAQDFDLPPAQRTPANYQAMVAQINASNPGVHAVFETASSPHSTGNHIHVQAAGGGAAPAPGGAPAQQAVSPVPRVNGDNVSFAAAQGAGVGAQAASAQPGLNSAAVNAQTNADFRNEVTQSTGQAGAQQLAALAQRRQQDLDLINQADKSLNKPFAQAQSTWNTFLQHLGVTYPPATSPQVAISLLQQKFGAAPSSINIKDPVAVIKYYTAYDAAQADYKARRIQAVQQYAAQNQNTQSWNSAQFQQQFNNQNPAGPFTNTAIWSGVSGADGKPYVRTQTSTYGNKRYIVGGVPYQGQ